MTKTAARNLFIFGSLFFFLILVYLTVDSLKAVDRRSHDDQITDQVNAGKMAWHKYDCIGCHTILGNGAYFAPDLTKIAAKKPHAYLVSWLQNPKSVNPQAMMPNLGVSPQEGEDLVVFLEWVSKIDTNNWPPEPILARAASVSAGTELSRGEELYRKNGCAACHAMKGVGGTTGPDLTQVGSRRNADWIYKHFKDPPAMSPGSFMPAFGHLPEDDLKALTEYLAALK